MKNNNETAIAVDPRKRQFVKHWHMLVALIFVMLLIEGKDFFQNISAGNWIGAAIPFGMALIVTIGGGVWQAFQAKRALVFSSLGIIDNSSRRPMFIPWSEIAGSDFVKKGDREFFVVKVRDPQKYRSDTKELNTLIHGHLINYFNSPFAFNCAGLKIALPELQSIFENYYQQYGTN